MTPERWQRIDKLLEEALELGASERNAFLDQACTGDAAMRHKVEALLAAHARAESFIETPALAAAAQSLAEQARLMVGRQLGHYQVLALLGTGGMGEVYRARDNRLERIVALKLLPAHAAVAEERMRRFVREAKAASALNHPNIATIYEIGEANGTHFIAMEYVEGQTLQARLNGQPLETAEIVEIATKIADALAEAHAKGITHRDIKPANVMLSSRGQVKVLDFGLAKVAPPEAQAVNIQSNTATATTQPGLVLGTLPYMSPEQVLGREVDQRSDIFSLGVALYEMATGRLPFAGATVSETMDRILHAQPEAVARFNYDMPAELERIVRKCLEKDREWRYQSARELLIDLRQLKRESGSSAVQVERIAAAPKRVSHWVWPAVSLPLGLLIILVVGAVWLNVLRRAPALPPPKIAPFTASPGNEMQPSFSPDGNQIAFAWTGERGDNYDIYVKVIGAETPLRLTEYPGEDTSPAWSPDGRHIAFIHSSQNERAIFLVPATGGPARRLHSTSVTAGAANNPSVRSPNLSWSPDGQFLAFSDPGPEGSPTFCLYLLSLSDIEKRQLTFPPPATRGDLTPTFSPDGKTVAFTQFNAGSGSEIYLVSAAGGTPRRLTYDNRIVEGLAWTPDGNWIIFSSNRTDNGGLYKLWKIPASGGLPQALMGGEGAFFPVVSRDGRRLAYGRRIEDQNIWRIDTLDTSSGNPAATRFISSTRRDQSAQYSPDGERIVFISDRLGTREIWVCNSDGSKPRQITAEGIFLGSPRWSPDGQQIAFDARPEGHSDILVVSAEGGRPRRITVDTSQEIYPIWSRDGRWLYFGSNRSGSWEVWKVPTEGGTPVKVTLNGGKEAVESFDSKFIYYTKGQGQSTPGLWRMPVGGGDEVRILDQTYSGQWALVETGIYFLDSKTKSPPTIKFFNFATTRTTHVATAEREPTRSPCLAISPDGRWILYTQVDRDESDIMLVENFR